MIKKKLVILVMVLTVVFVYFSYDRPVYSFDKETSSFSYNNRGRPLFSKVLIEDNYSFDVFSINYNSRPFSNYSINIYGHLFMPNSSDDEKVPALIILPGGGEKKESERELSIDIVNLGYAVFIIDQRGIGETENYYLDPNEDYQAFNYGLEPIQHLGVYDALAAFDVLHEIDGIDDDNIAVSGISMGGRYAIIAGALEKRLKGVVIISSAGFHFDGDNSYFLSIDPDHYIGRIFKRPLFMLHGNNDSVVKLEDAERTFLVANEPKRFFVADGCGHGYCGEMWDELKHDLEIIFD